MAIKILNVEQKEYEEITIEANPPQSGLYRRHSAKYWEHWINRNGGLWLKVNDPEPFEKAYQEWKRKKSKS